MQSRFATGPQSVEKGAKQTHSPRNRHMLKDDERYDQVEIRVGDFTRKNDVADSGLFGILPRVEEHFRSDVHSHHMIGALRQGQRQPSDTAAEIERVRRRAFTDQMKEMIDIRTSAGEKVAARFRRQARGEKAFVGENGEVWLAVRELFPTTPRRLRRRRPQLCISWSCCRGSCRRCRGFRRSCDGRRQSCSAFPR